MASATAARVINRRRAPHFRVQTFGQSDVDRFAKDAWGSTNEGFEQLVYEAKKTAERIDRTYSVSRRLSDVAQSAAERACELDREYEVGIRWRTFSMVLLEIGLAGDFIDHRLDGDGNDFSSEESKHQGPALGGREIRVVLREWQEEEEGSHSA